MDVGRFVYELHYDTDTAKPAEWEPDWEDAPLPYKLYRGLPYFALPSDVPLTLEPGAWRQAATRLAALGTLLWYAYGIAQVSRSAANPDSLQGTTPAALALCRRTVPSGGGLYPGEVYLCLSIDELPCGVYHYDAAHHRLTLLREGTFGEYLNRALGGRIQPRDAWGAVIVTAVYWKNFFKYHNFAYRLQGLDVGIVTAQLREAARRLGMRTGLHFHFLDRAVHRLLGISGREESAYAILTLRSEGWTEDAAATGIENRNIRKHARETAAELCRELPAVRHETFSKSKNVIPSPLIERMNELSACEAAPLPGPASLREPVFHAAGRPVPLPQGGRAIRGFAEIARRRYSPESDFVLRRVSLETLAGILRETRALDGGEDDPDGSTEPSAPRLHLYGSFYGVEGLDAGAYRYDSRTHSLIPIRPGDHRQWLQSAMLMHNVNMSQVPLCFHVAGDRSHHLEAWGPRGYRIQQAEAGMLAQRLLLAAASFGLAGRPLLGYDTAACDVLYRLGLPGLTTLLQIPVGAYRYRGRYEAGLHR